MYKIPTRLPTALHLPINYGRMLTKVTTRKVSALYITGDKARENYVTIQPYLDFKGTFERKELLEASIKGRKMTTELNQVHNMFENYKEAVKAIDNVGKERENIAKVLKELSKIKDKNEGKIKELMEQGKDLRNKLKSMKTDLYPVEDEFIQSFLHLPNLLHPQCPDGDFERVLYRSKPGQKNTNAKFHLDHKDLIRFIDNSRYYLLKDAAEFDFYCSDALSKYFLKQGNFIQTCNPDFVRCVLLEANATHLEHYHKVMEEHLQNKLNCAYLTGGASFESFLGAVTKLCVYPSCIPLKYVSNGRLYEKSSEGSGNQSSLYTATQTNAVQTFVATLNGQQSEEQMDAILNLCVDFYKSFVNLDFRVIYVKAADLTPSESLRAQIEVYSPHEKRYICLGRISNYTDYVSKRILFTMREQKDYNFLHLVGGPVLYTTRLIAALIESEEPLDYAQLMKTLKLKQSNDTNQTATTNSSSNKAIDEFQSLFK